MTTDTVWTVQVRFVRAARYLERCKTALAPLLLQAAALAALITVALYWGFFQLVAWHYGDTAAMLQAVAGVATYSGAPAAAPGTPASCALAERAALQFRVEHETAGVNQGLPRLLAVITPSPQCQSEGKIAPQYSCRAGGSAPCTSVLMRLQRNVLGVPTPVVETPVQAVTREFEALVSSAGRLVQCSSSPRGNAEEYALCAASARIEGEVSALIGQSGAAALRRANGPFAVIAVWMTVLLILFELRNLHAMRAASRAVRHMRRGDADAPQLPWSGAADAQGAHAAWQAFLGQRVAGWNLDGRALAEASPFLAAHGAAIVALRSGGDVRDAVEQVIRAFREAADIAGGISRFLVYAIPTVGFVATAFGLGNAMRLTAVAQSADPARQAFARALLGDSVVVAFDTTMIALAASLLALATVHYCAQAIEQIIERVRREVDVSLSPGGSLAAVAASALDAPRPAVAVPSAPPAELAPASHGRNATAPRRSPWRVAVPVLTAVVLLVFALGGGGNLVQALATLRQGLGL